MDRIAFNLKPPVPRDFGLRRIPLLPDTRIHGSKERFERPRRHVPSYPHAPPWRAARRAR